MDLSETVCFGHEGSPKLLGSVERLKARDMVSPEGASCNDTRDACRGGWSLVLFRLNRIVGIGSSGMILVLGTRGRGFDSLNPPPSFYPPFVLSLIAFQTLSVDPSTTPTLNVQAI